MDEKDKIYAFLDKYANKNGLPIIPKKEWIEFRDSYDKKILLDTFGHYIVDRKPKFPFQSYELDEIKNSFLELRKNSLNVEYPQTIDEKYDFKYSYLKNPLGVIYSTRTFNCVSNYYQQHNRYNVGSVWHPSPLFAWGNVQEIKHVIRFFWGDAFLDNFGVSEPVWRGAFRIFYYTCSQFNPTVAKFLYTKTQALKILDLCCGWGDRLAGFYGTPKAEEYIGCDPNTEVYASYKKQCVDYEKFLGYDAKLVEYDDYFECTGSKFVRIYNLPSEDIDWSQYENYFDVMFTSPPYFDLEKYEPNNEKQSWNRYKGFDAWRDDFFYPLCKKTIPTIKEDGFYIINITEPKTKGGKSNYCLCDDIVDTIQSYNLNYVGKLGLKLETRPSKLKLKAESNFITIEPIYCFRRNNAVWNISNTLDQFFQ